MALKVAEVLIRWRQEGQQQVVSQNKQMGQSFTDLGNKAKAAGAVLTAGLTAPLVLIGKQAVDAASDLNEATSAVTTVFGTASDEMIRFTRTAASQLGQSKQAALGAAAALGALFKGVGLTEDQMADFSSSLLTASADLGSFYNIDPGQALQNLRSGLVGEAEPLRRFGILINEAAVEAKALELGLVAVDEELSEGVKVQARYALIMDQLGAAQGDFERTSGGLANQQRILAARMQDVRAEIGTYLLPYALRLSGLFSQLLDRFQQLDEKSRGLAVALGAVAAAAGPVLIVLGQILPVVAKLVPLITGLISPLGLVVGAVVALGVAFKENWFGIRDLVGNVVERIGNTIGRMIEFFQHARERGLTPFRLAFRTLIVTLGEQLGKDHPVVDFLQEVLRLGERLAGAFQTGGITAVVDELTKQVPKLQDWFGGQFDRAKTFGAQLVQTLVQSFQGINWSLIANTIQSGLGTFKDWVGDRLSGALSFGGELLQNILSGLSEVNWPLIAQTVKDGLGQFADWVGDRLGEALTFGGMLIQKLVDGFKGVNWDLVGSQIQAGLQLALSVLKELGTWVGDRLREVDWADVGMRAFNLVQVVGESLLTGMRNQLLALRDLGTWVWDRIQEVDWEEVKTALYNAGSALIGVAGEKGGGLLGGIWNKFLEVAKFFQNIGASIIGALPKDWGELLYQSGQDLIQGMWDGAIAKMDEFRAWLAANDPAGEAARADEERRRRQNEEAPGTGRALGGPLNRKYTWVGEYGPELLINKQLVMPHGAAQSRMQAMGGMAYGGSGYWREWLQEQDGRTRRAIRAMRAAGQLSASVREQLMSGMGVSEFSAASRRDRREGATEAEMYSRRRARIERNSPAEREARRFERLNEGYNPRGQGAEAREERRAEREARRAEREQRNTDAINRATATSESTGGTSRRDREMRRESRGTTRVGSSRDGGDSYQITSYGTIKVYPPDADIARAIGEQIAGSRR